MVELHEPISVTVYISPVSVIIYLGFRMVECLFIESYFRRFRKQTL